MTIGGSGAVTGPSSGIVTWKSERASSRNALERFVGAVELVDEKDRRAVLVWAHGLEERAFDQVLGPEEPGLERVGIGATPGFGGADGDHLGWKVPFVDGAGGIQPLVALQPDQPATEARGDGLGDLGLAHAGLALEKERPAEAEGQEGHGGKRPAADIVLALQHLLHGVDRVGRGHRPVLLPGVGPEGHAGRPASRRGASHFRRASKGCLGRLLTGRGAGVRTAVPGRTAPLAPGRTRALGTATWDARHRRSPP